MEAVKVVISLSTLALNVPAIRKERPSNLVDRHLRGATA